MSVTVLVTGFGPFPGAPFNPTGPLVHRLASLRRPILTDVKIAAHVFPTSYAAVDRDFPALIARHKPDALLMFGLAPRAKTLRIETRARNAVGSLPDAIGHVPLRSAIAPGDQSTLIMPAPFTILFAAARAARLPVVRSRDAGTYLCNYLCWCASEKVRNSRRPRLATFVHVPPVRRGARPCKATKKRPTLDELTRTASLLLVALVAAARR
jgi:pyroglutamyl-peptidase